MNNIAFAHIDLLPFLMSVGALGWILTIIVAIGLCSKRARSDGAALALVLVGMAINVTSSYLMWDLTWVVWLSLIAAGLSVLCWCICLRSWLT